MVGTRWMFRTMMIVALCALPGLVFAAGVSTPAKAAAKDALPQVPSTKPQLMNAPPPQGMESVSSTGPRVPAPAPASKDMTKTVKSLASQVESLKKELEQFKKAEQEQSKTVRKRHVR
jgi:hypothetical protein